jgi:hypothetical protein
MRISGFDKHKLIISLMPIIRDYISKQSPEKIKSNPTRKEKRVMEIVLKVNTITECIDQLYFSIEMLSGYRKRKNSKMNRHDYIVFMIENYYLRITSIFDRILRFCNIVYEIGLPEKECRESTIIKNKKIKGTNIEKILNKINKFSNEFKPIRNKVAHQESFYDSKLSYVQAYYLLIEEESSDELMKYKNIYKSTSDSYVIEKKDDLLEATNRLKEMISEFFDLILPIIEQDLVNYSDCKTT